MVNKRKKYSPEEKAKIVLEVLREENTLVEISNKYEVSPAVNKPMEIRFSGQHAISI
jgi:transposase-like protein